jgi:hypothetical protein
MCFYDKELYALVQAIKYWRHYLDGKRNYVHIDHLPLKFLQSQNKIEEARHMKWASYLQQFHLVIKYKKGSTNTMVDCLSRPPSFHALTVLTTSHLGFQTWASQYPDDPNFGHIYKSLQHPTSSNLVPLQYFHIKEGLLYKFDKLCVPHDHHLSLLKEAHFTLYGGHFGKQKTLHHLQ